MTLCQKRLFSVRLLAYESFSGPGACRRSRNDKDGMKKSSDCGVQGHVLKNISTFQLANSNNDLYVEAAFVVEQQKKDVVKKDISCVSL